MSAGVNCPNLWGFPACGTCASEDACARRMPLPAPGADVTADAPFAPTILRWYNDAGDPSAKIMCIAGKVEDIPYGYRLTREFHAGGKPPHPVHGQFQDGYACSRTARTIGLDGDYPGKWAGTATGRLLGPWRDCATSFRKDRKTGEVVRFHVMIMVPPELAHLWPRQLAAPFGHVKSNGFTYTTGVHATGDTYEETGRAWVVATEALMRALLEDNGGYLHANREAEHADDLEELAAAWERPDDDYASSIAADVLGNWAEGTRNDSLPARCGIIKAAGEQGISGMRTLFYALADEYAAATGRGDKDVYRAFARCYPAYAKVSSSVPDFGLKAPELPSQDGSGPQAAVKAGPLLDEHEAREWARAQEPAQFISPKDGLLAMALGHAVLRMGPLAKGLDNRAWKYAHGVWVPAPNEVRDRTVLLLRDSYRRSYSAAAEDVAMTFAPVITSEPVEQYVNCANGLLDWRTLELKPHSPDVLSTVQLPVDWEPAAKCPQFLRWLVQVVPLDCVELVLDLAGYLAYSGNPLHCAVMLTGSGRNGKGTFLRVVKGLLGAANVTAASLADLTATRFTTASLFGKIANIAGDIDGSYLENTAAFKAITGGDLISAEHKGRDRFDFTPWAVPVFSANRVPASADTSAGYLSRWLVVPFPNSFEGREDRTLDGRLAAELPGILALCAPRLPALLARGQWALTDSALDAKAEFSRRVDQVRYWLSEYTEPDSPGALVSRSFLYQCYRNWAARDGGKPVRAAEFYERLAAAGVSPSRTAAGRWFSGVRVTNTCGYIDAYMSSDS